MGLLFVPIWTQTISKVNKADPPRRLQTFQLSKMLECLEAPGGSDLLREVTEKLREVSEKLRGVSETLWGA